MELVTVEKKHPPIVLSMIVKNEAHVIREALASARPLIDAWIVCDTGSTDGTQALIREALDGIPGELHERPWVNFGANRTEALDRAHAAYPDGYALILDADDTLEPGPDFTWPQTQPPRDAYHFAVSEAAGGMTFNRVHLLRLARGWRYEGALHEFPTPKDGGSSTHGGTVANLVYRSSRRGARSLDPAKYAKDAALLVAELNKPGQASNTRTIFYLAQSLRDAGFLYEALYRYEQRADLGGWNEEVFVARLEAARLKERLKRPFTEVRAAYLRAHESRPVRAEAIYELARYCREQSRYDSAYRYARRASRIPRPEDTLFVRDDVYTCGVHDELSLAAHFTERHEEALRHVACARAVKPDDHRLRQNEGFMRAAALKALRP